MKIENIDPIKNESEQSTQNSPENAEIQQSNIANEYLRKNEELTTLSIACQNALKNLDSARNEQQLSGSGNEIISKLEGEYKTLSGLVDAAQLYMNRLFDQLTDASKEKYLTIKEETPQEHE